ncbi:proton pump-interactor 1-like [Populus alba x Populus x berolinensis]|uniref:Proton pump-interactor 1-like n=1 Tax=Populus alba x Populus x berolinensis TaxID=444605 RepID=A0AAD6RT83_9ROSI|nr:proton pump-interactor 1-like [Populus alba x Populus x berolinensis]
MGVEVVAPEKVQAPIDSVSEVDETIMHEKENLKLDEVSGLAEPIQFGSHGEEPVRAEGNDVTDANLPKDAIDEWPAPKQIHSFYFVTYRQYDDPKIKSKIDQADKEIQKRNLSRFEITEKLKAKRAKRAELVNQVRTLKNEGRQYKSMFDEKKKKMEPLQHALGKLRDTNSAGRGGLCSSEEELNDLIYSLQYRIQHESIPLTEEKQILREIKQFEGTREKVIANAAMRAKIQDSMGQKEAIQDQVKLIGVDLDGVRKEQQVLWGKVDGLDGKVKALDAEIKTLQDELTAVTLKRDKAYETIQELRKQRDEAACANQKLCTTFSQFLTPTDSTSIYYFKNANFYQCRKLLTKAKELAARKDVPALEELAHAEVENFMSLWSHNKAFRDDYEKRILPSLDRRQMSKDGRIRNPDEKPLVILETPILSEPEPVVKAIAKRPKEDPKPTSQKDALPPQKVQKETTKTELKTTSEHSDIIDKEVSGLENLQKNPSEEKEVDEAKLKEMKREEEIAKAKQAMERKKKLAEKAAAKAAARAQKDAEKKLKEREKKLKKKAAATEPEEPVEAVAEAESEMVEVNDEVPVPVKEKVWKENTVRPRNRSRGPGSLPKVIPRRKKSTNYWIWAAPAALGVLVFLALGYYYYLL